MDRKRLEEIKEIGEAFIVPEGWPASAVATYKVTDLQIFYWVFKELLEAAESMVYMQERFPSTTDQIETFRRESTAEWKEEE